MRIASYRSANDTQSFGILDAEGEGIVDLRERLGLPDAKALLEAGVEQAAAFGTEPADHRLADVVLLPPVPNPAHIFGIGLNTHSHLKEAAEFLELDLEVPPYPHVFLRTPASQVGHGASVVIPKVSRTLDFEGEIAVVIGTAGRNIARADALSHIAGVSCYNEGSVRAYQQHSQQVVPAKNFVASGSFGPWLVTLDEAGPLDELVLETRINGELQQHLEMHDLIFGFAELIEYLSQPFELQPGDVIVTGSPAGVGVIRGRYLQAGDEIEIEMPTVGKLRNSVIAEGPAS